MKTLTHKEALAHFDKLSELAYGIAEALGTTPEKCNDPICHRWRKLNCLDELEENMLLILTDFDEPLCLVTDKGARGDDMRGGLMSVEASALKDIYVEKEKIVVEYKDGIVEKYIPVKGYSHVFEPYSTTQPPVITMPHFQSAN
jgi:hypothetical protein